MKLNVSELNPEDIVWACAYEYSYDKNCMLLRATPVMGMVTCDGTEIGHERYMEQQRHPRYFVPFKVKSNTKTSKDLAWSKAVKIHSRCYALTEQESEEIYNHEIDYYINDFKNKIMEFESDKIGKEI